MSASRRHHEPLPPEARRVLLNRMWDRLFQPLPTEVVVDPGNQPDPPDPVETHRRKELPR